MFVWCWRRSCSFSQECSTCCVSDCCKLVWIGTTHCFTLPFIPKHRTYTPLQSHHHIHISHPSHTHTTPINTSHIGEAWHMEEEEDRSRGARYGSTTGHMDQAIFTNRLNRHYFHPTPHPSAHPPSTMSLPSQTLRHPGLLQELKWPIRTLV